MRRGRLRWRVPGARAAALALSYPAAMAADAAAWATSQFPRAQHRHAEVGYVAAAVTLILELWYVMRAIRDASACVQIPSVYVSNSLHFDVVIYYDPVSPCVGLVTAGAIAISSVATLLHWASAWIVALASARPSLLGVLAWGVALDFWMD